MCISEDVECAAFTFEGSKEKEVEARPFLAGSFVEVLEMSQNDADFTSFHDDDHDTSR
jgi:hypothetical protein